MNLRNFKRLNLIFGLIISIVFLFGIIQTTKAADYNDTADGDWNNAATWGGGGIPGSGDNVTIDSHVVNDKASVEHLMEFYQKAINQNGKLEDIYAHKHDLYLKPKSA